MLAAFVLALVATVGTATPAAAQTVVQETTRFGVSSGGHREVVYMPWSSLSNTARAVECCFFHVDGLVNAIVGQPQVSISGVENAEAGYGGGYIWFRCTIPHPAFCPFTGGFSVTVTMTADVYDPRTGEVRRQGLSGTRDYRIGPPPEDVDEQNVAPVARFTWEKSPTEPRTVIFTNRSTDADGDELTSSWTFGHEGGASTERSPTHTFPAGDNFTVTLTVDDGQGGKASETQTIQFRDLVVNSTGDSHALDPEVGCNTGNTVGDEPECTLRAAIQTANAEGGGEISFDIIGAGVPTIAPGSLLPDVGPGVTIDGTTQGGGFVRIDGGDNLSRGLVLAGGTSRVTGMVIDRVQFGILAQSGSGHIVEGNRIGTTADGEGLGLVTFGVALFDVNGAVVRDNTLHCGTCINLARGTGGVVSGNSISVSPAGNAFAGSGLGIWINDGNAEVSDNVVNSNLVGILVTEARAGGTVVRGNFVGTTRAGVGTNGPDQGIRIDAAPDVTVTQNVVTARGQGGILVTGSRQLTSANEPLGPEDDVQDGPVTGGRVVVTDNLVGVLPNQTVAPARSTDGVVVWASADQVTIRDNVLTGQRRAGVLVRGGSGHQIHGNAIGTNRAGTSGPAQPFGIALESTVNARIGATGAGNTIRVTDQAVSLGNGTSGAHVVANTIRDAITGIGTPGNVGDDDTPVVNDALIEANTIDVSGTGVLLGGEMRNAVVRANVIRGGDIAGILVDAGVPEARIDRNTVLGAARGVLNRGPGADVTANRIGIDATGTVVGSPLAGIALDAGATVVDNVVVGSGDFGIVVGADAVGQLRGNEIHGTEGVPIHTETGPAAPELSAVVRLPFGETDRTMLVVTGIPTGEAGIVEVFANADCSDPEARYALRITHTVAADRTWAVVPVLDRPDRDSFTVTYRTTGAGTSALSNCAVRASHPDSDGDGSVDPIEELVGTADDGTRAVLVTDDGDLLMIDSADGVLRSARIVEAPQLDGVTFPHGLVSFAVEGLEPGAEATIAVGVIDGAASGGDAYWKYGPSTPGAPSSWYRFDIDEVSGTGAHADVVDYGAGIGLRRMWVLSFVDGARGDHDGVADGRIVDPGGPGIGQPTAPPQGPSGPATAAPRRTVERLHGPDRYATAAEVAGRYSPGVSTVFVATGENFPDALAGAARAGALGAPLLLTRGGSLPSVTRAELARLRPGRVVVLGGPAVVSEGVLAAIRAAVGDAAVTRVGGADRYATAALLAAGLGPVDVVYVATGADFPDALAGAARAGAWGAPLLLVRRDSIPDATADALRALSPGRIVVLGGTSSVSAAVFDALGTFGTAQRIHGADRYATAAAIASGSPSAGAVFVATGEDFSDALAGAALAGHLGVPLLLTRPGSLPASTGAQIDRLDPGTVYITGGTTAVSGAVADALAAG